MFTGLEKADTFAVEGRPRIPPTWLPVRMDIHNRPERNSTSNTACVWPAKAPGPVKLD
jgi:hypothetical protein